MSSRFGRSLALLLLAAGACVEPSPTTDSSTDDESVISRPEPSVCGVAVEPDGWVCAPPGRFELGAGGCYGDLDAEGATGVFVTLTRPLWVASDAVSGAEWYELMAEYTDERFQYERYDEVYGNISYGAALLYANRLSEAEGLSPCYTLGWEVGCRPFYYDEFWTDFECEDGAAPGYDPACSGYRLPTIVEREWFVRAGGALDWPELLLCQGHPWFGEDCYHRVSEWVFDRTSRGATGFDRIDYFPQGEHEDPLLHDELGIDGGIPLAAFPLPQRNVCHDITSLGLPALFPSSGLRLVRTATEGETLSDQPVR